MAVTPGVALREAWSATKPSPPAALPALLLFASPALGVVGTAAASSSSSSFSPATAR